MRGLCSISSSQLLPPAWGILGNWAVCFCSRVSVGLLVGWSYRQRRHCENPDVPNHVLKSEKLQGARRQASSPHLARGLPCRGNFLQAPPPSSPSRVLVAARTGKSGGMVVVFVDKQLPPTVPLAM